MHREAILKCFMTEGYDRVKQIQMNHMIGWTLNMLTTLYHDTNIVTLFLNKIVNDIYCI